MQNSPDGAESNFKAARQCIGPPLKSAAYGQMSDTRP